MSTLGGGAQQKKNNNKKKDKKKAEEPKEENNDTKEEQPKQEETKEEAPKQEITKQEPPKEEAKQEAPNQENAAPSSTLGKGASLGGATIGGATLGGGSSANKDKEKDKKKKKKKGAKEEKTASAQEPAKETPQETSQPEESSESAPKKPEEKEMPEKKDMPEEKATKGAKGAKKAAKAKKGAKPAIGKLIAAQLNKKKEEEEKKRREEEERRRIEEEEMRKEEEERKKKEEEERAKKDEDKVAKKKRKEEEDKKRLEEEKKAKLARYVIKNAGERPKPAAKPKQKKNLKFLETREEEKKNEEEQQREIEEQNKEEEAVEKKEENKEPAPLVDDWEQLEDVPVEKIGEVVKMADSWEDFNPSSLVEKKEDPKPEKPRVEKKEETKQPPKQPHTDEQEDEEEEEDTTDSSASVSGPQVNAELRSPIVCVLGHVDVGKTKLLDKIRHTHVQDDEAGGITQQIGATWFPIEALRERVFRVSTKKQFTLDVPGLLIIDTPGHESFTNLRSRGSSLCDIAILVVDIMHGIEQQTVESIKLLQLKNTPFIVALNKVDRIYGWTKTEGAAFNNTFKKQPKNTQAEFKKLLNRTIVDFAEQGINAKLYKEIKNFDEWVALVPTSAHTGEGIPDLLLLITQYAQKKLKNTIAYEEKFEATVLEVKPVEGIGKTIDVIIVNGVLRKGDEIVLCGLSGPIVTSVKTILTPHPLRELRVKNEYMQHESIKAAQGVKIVASGQDLERAVPGSPLFVCNTEEELEEAKNIVMRDYEKLRANINKEGHGVYVNSSTLGALEALLHFLKSEKIPVGDFSIGPVHKKDVMKAGTMIERKLKKYAVILAFDVKITPEADQEAKKLGVEIMDADIIYTLTDKFKKYLEKLDEEERKAHAGEAVFPCVLEILPEFIFNTKNPIVVGVKVVDGELRRGTPITVPSKKMIDLGVVTNIQVNNKDIEIGKKGEEVAVSISPASTSQHYLYARHFDHSDLLFSKISRRSLDAMKKFFYEDTSKHLDLLKKLKKLFHID